MRKFTFSEEIKTITFYILIILFGLILSSIVYLSVRAINSTTTDLVETHITTLSLTQQVIASVTEQEQSLYEYYSTIDESVYLRGYLDGKQITTKLIDELVVFVPNKSETESIYISIGNISAAATLLHQTMLRKDPIDRTTARAQLAIISQQKRLLINTLKHIESQTNIKVEQAYGDVSYQLTRTQTTVIIYIISIITLAVVTARYMRQYFNIAKKTKRLALLSERNPHPIVSVDQYKKIIYYNTATAKLINLSQDNPLQISDLIPNQYLALCVTAKKPQPSIQVEHSLPDRTLNCEIHWHSELKVFDLHLSDITEEKKAKERLNFQAFHNPDTSLQNGYKLRDSLSLKIDKQQSFSLGLLELRNYSRYVTGHGVEATLKIIQGTAARLQQTINQSAHDIELFQINERTFAIIINDTTDAEKIEESYRFIEVRMDELLTTEYGEFSVILDYGFCCFPEHGDNRYSLLQNARIALDEAINFEHSHFSFYSPQLSLQLNETIKLTEWLKNAIKNNELELFYQPQKCVNSDHIIGMEALIRWQHAGQSISPVDFIPIAEQTGLIIDIGQWILHEACQMTKNLVDQGHKALVIAVNISPRQFRHPNFLAMVERVLADTQLKPENLELEITEGVMLYNESSTIAVLHQLKALGILLSIDDFGTGYSSLSYLKQFPINKLKVDQSFIKHLHTNNEDKAIVRAIIDLGKNLNLKTIAEGVEYPEHYQYLKDIGCDEIQGYWFSKPLPQKAFIEFLNQHQVALSCPAVIAETASLIP